MDGSVLEKKSSFKMLGLSSSSKLNWGSYSISITKTASKNIEALILSLNFLSPEEKENFLSSIVKTASKKIETLILSLNFLSPEVALYLYKSAIRPFMECCYRVWAGAPSCYLEILEKLQKIICRTVSPLVVASLEPLGYRRNIGSLSRFIVRTLVDSHLNWLSWFHFLILVAGLLVILIGFSILLDRKFLFEVKDCVVFLSQSRDLKKPLKIKYTAGGEQGLDMGGLQKEFFQVVVETMFDPSMDIILALPFLF